jgi:hypothetical protein
MARRYASDRAGDSKELQQVLRGDIPRGDLGRVLDLTGDSRWRDFSQRPLYPEGPTPESLIRGPGNENYWKFFQSFLQENNLRLEDYDAVIGPEYVRGGTQVCLRTPSVQAKARAPLSVFESGANFVPVAPPSSGGSGSGGTPPPAPTPPAKPGTQGGGTAGRGEEVKPIENPALEGQAKGTPWSQRGSSHRPIVTAPSARKRRKRPRPSSFQASIRAALSASRAPGSRSSASGSERWSRVHSAAVGSSTSAWNWMP